MFFALSYTSLIITIYSTDKKYIERLKFMDKKIENKMYSL